MNIRPPILYNSLDIEDPTRRSTQPIQEPKKEWRNTLIIAVTLVIFLCSFSGFFWLVFRELSFRATTFFGTEQRFSGYLVWITLLLPFIIAGLMLFIGATNLNRWLTVLIKRQELINVMEYQTTVNNLPLLDSLLTQQYLNVNRTRAAESRFAGVSTLTVANNAAAPDNIAATEAIDEVLPAMLPAGDKPILRELQDQGLIWRSNESILIGFSNE